MPAQVYVKKAGEYKAPVLRYQDSGDENSQPAYTDPDLNARGNQTEKKKTEALRTVSKQVEKKLDNITKRQEVILEKFDAAVDPIWKETKKSMQSVKTDDQEYEIFELYKSFARSMMVKADVASANEGEKFGGAIREALNTTVEALENLLKTKQKLRKKVSSVDY